MPTIALLFSPPEQTGHSPELSFRCRFGMRALDRAQRSKQISNASCGPTKQVGAGYSGIQTSKRALQLICTARPTWVMQRKVVTMTSIKLRALYSCAQRLKDGLLSQASATGWSDPTIENAPILWTTVNVATVLLEYRLPFPHFASIKAHIHNLKREYSPNVFGWPTPSSSEVCSVYVTADVGFFYYYARDLDSLNSVLESLFSAQNSDGGWGVCYEDGVSRVVDVTTVRHASSSHLNQGKAVGDFSVSRGGGARRTAGGGGELPGCPEARNMDPRSASKNDPSIA
jgi:hypothetical protein